MCYAYLCFITKKRYADDRMATLMDYQDKGVPEPERFYAMYKDLPQDRYRERITETYGQASGRDHRMERMVNAAVLAYVLGK